MGTTDETIVAIADTYANALLELSEEQGLTDRVLEELRELQHCASSDATVASFLTGVNLDLEVRRNTLERLFRGRMCDLLVNTLLVLNAKGRAEIISHLYERFRLAVEGVRNEVDVYVTSAVPLSAEHRSKLVSVLQGRTGKKPELVETVDASLLGGLVVQIGDEKIDISALHKLQRLAGSLRERGSREIHAGREDVELGREES